MCELCMYKLMLTFQVIMFVCLCGKDFCKKEQSIAATLGCLLTAIW